MSARGHLKHEHLSDRVNRVEQWQSSSAEYPPSSQAIYSRLEENGTIAKLFQRIVELYKILLHEHQQSTAPGSAQEKKLKRILDMLQIWGHAYDVGNGQLDRLLDRSTEIRITAISLLMAIGEILSRELSAYVFLSEEARLGALQASRIHDALEEARFQVDEGEAFGNDSESDNGDALSDANHGQKIDEIANTLNQIIEDLTQLDDLFSSADKDRQDDGHRAPSLTLMDQEPHSYYASLVSARFPGAERGLVDWLGKANWERFKRLQPSFEANVVLQESETSAEAKLQGPSAEGSASIAASNAIESKFQDSGIGSSMPATAMSLYSTRTQGGGPQVPRLPEEAANGMRFTCSVCGKRIRINGYKEWKKHVYADLQPYICVYVDCDHTTVFVDRTSWVDHLSVSHNLDLEWQNRQCPLCLEYIGPGWGVISVHVAKHMEEISLAALPREPDSESDMDSEIHSVISNKSSRARMSRSSGLQRSPELATETSGEVARLESTQMHAAAGAENSAHSTSPLPTTAPVAPSSGWENEADVKEEAKEIFAPSEAFAADQSKDSIVAKAPSETDHLDGALSPKSGENLPKMNIVTSNIAGDRNDLDVEFAMLIHKEHGSAELRICRLHTGSPMVNLVASSALQGLAPERRAYKGMPIQGIEGMKSDIIPEWEVELRWHVRGKSKTYTTWFAVWDEDVVGADLSVDILLGRETIAAKRFLIRNTEVY